MIEPANIASQDGLAVAQRDAIAVDEPFAFFYADSDRWGTLLAFRDHGSRRRWLEVSPSWAPVTSHKQLRVALEHRRFFEVYGSVTYNKDEKAMKVDMRIHPPIRDQVHAGISALQVQARQIWGPDRIGLNKIVIRLTVGVGDLARLARDRTTGDGYELITYYSPEAVELKKELGNVLFSIIRWIDDLGLDVLECLDLAIEAQEKFAGSGRPR